MLLLFLSTRWAIFRLFIYWCRICVHFILSKYLFLDFVWAAFSVGAANIRQKMPHEQEQTKKIMFHSTWTHYASVTDEKLLFSDNFDFMPIIHQFLWTVFFFPSFVFVNIVFNILVINYFIFFMMKIFLLFFSNADWLLHNPDASKYDARPRW